MSVGTKSLLFGYHQFLLHPIGVAIAWWKLYGFPWDPRLWVAFFVHDLGYWGKPNMDGAEGEKHPFRGANIMHALFDSWRHARPFRWYEFTLYHSRFLARNHDVAFSQLCVADKYLIVLMPTWLQVLLTRVTGEIKEYRRGQNGRTPAGEMSDRQWVEAMKTKIRDWMEREVSQKNESAEPPHPTLSPRGEGHLAVEPEDEAARAEGRDESWIMLVLVAACVLLTGSWAVAWRWVKWKRVCAWCERKHWMGGNPFGWKRTHGLCREAMETQRTEIGRQRSPHPSPSPQSGEGNPSGEGDPLYLGQSVGRILLITGLLFLAAGCKSY